MKRTPLLAALVASSTYAAVPNDFAYGLRLDAPPGHSVYSIELPMPVYAGVTRPDLGDLRVFNRRGAEVPYVLRLPKLLQREAGAPVDAAVYPLFGEAAHALDVAARGRTDARGVILELQSGRTLDDEPPAAYLVDLAPLTAPPTNIRLQWNREAGALAFVTHLSLFVSDDLVHWNPLVSDATIADLDHGDDRIVHGKVELPSFSGRYLRFSWPEAVRDVQVTGAQVEFAAPASYATRKWLPLEAKPIESEPHQFQYRSSGYFPVDCVRAAPATTNTVMQVSLWSRASDKAPWRLRGQGPIYSLALAREGLTSDPFCFAPTTDPAWRLDVAPTAQGVPRLELGWTPHRLLFVARGGAPYTLAYGSVYAGPARGGDPLLRKPGAPPVGVAKATVTGEPIVLGGAGRTRAAIPERPWHGVAAWSALALGGVLLLGWIGWRWMRKPRGGPFLGV